jgi:adenosylhomocysteine nucleosidase
MSCSADGRASYTDEDGVSAGWSVLIEGTLRHVVVLAPMPLEMDAIVRAFALSDAQDGRFSGKVGLSTVRAVHIGMGPEVTRVAIKNLLAGDDVVDHIMIAGICGGLDPDLEVGTLLNPEVIIDHATKKGYRHTPPGDTPRSGKLVTTEVPTLDWGLSKRFFEDGCLGVDMESSAVGEVCEDAGCPWSVYRCIGDRYFDGFLDDRVLALTNPDGSGNPEQLGKLLSSEPDLARNLERLAHDTAIAARLAAEAALRGCLALDSHPQI